MHLNSYLVKSGHVIYCLSVQRSGVDKRMSLRTRDPKRARISAFTFGVVMANNVLGFDFLNNCRWVVKTK